MALQPRQPQKLTGSLQTKTGPGTLRRPSDVTGPAQQIPKNNQAAQSSRSKQAETKSGAHSAGLGDNPRVIAREGLTVEYPPSPAAV